MFQKEVHVVNRAGIHTRPAATLVKLAARFKSNIYLERDGYSVNAKSIIGVMTLAAEYGAALNIQANGIDEQQAIVELSQLFENGFGEI
jgi:phosphocarrier protein HPr